MTRGRRRLTKTREEKRRERAEEEETVLAVRMHLGGILFISALFLLFFAIILRDHLSAKFLVIFFAIPVMIFYKYKLTCTNKSISVGGSSPMPLNGIKSITVKKWPLFNWGKITITDKRGETLNFFLCYRPGRAKFQIEWFAEHRKGVMLGYDYGQEAEVSKKHFDKRERRRR